MKKFHILFIASLTSLCTIAQSPEKMSYQAVVRDASNSLVTSSSVGMQISILQGSTSGSSIYIETQIPTSNANGLVSIEIGGGTIVSGDFSSIDWANGPYYIQTETDPNGGTNYTITGISQLLSVPYALHSKTAESLSDEILETDPVFGTSLASGITASDTANWNYHFNGEYSSLSGIPTNVSTFTNDAGYITSEEILETDPVFGTSLASGITASDTANWNYHFNGEYSSLSGIPTNVSTFTNDAGYITSLNDDNPTNEIQQLSVSYTGDTLILEGGGFLIIPGISASNNPFAGTWIGTYTGDDNGTFTMTIEGSGNIIGEFYSNVFEQSSSVTGYVDENGNCSGETEAGSTLTAVINSDGTLVGEWSNSSLGSGQITGTRQ